MYSIVYTKKSLNDIPKLKSAKLDDKVKALIELIKENPYKTPPPFEKLQGDLQGAYSRRINIKHRFVYEVFEKEKVIKIISMWTHYEI
ncbi:MAG: Txe/YoeB family addiction module toxin [Candidatus Fimenecus sp.]